MPPERLPRPVDRTREGKTDPISQWTECKQNPNKPVQRSGRDRQVAHPWLVQAWPLPWIYSGGRIPQALGALLLILGADWLASAGAQSPQPARPRLQAATPARVTADDFPTPAPSPAPLPNADDADDTPEPFELIAEIDAPTTASPGKLVTLAAVAEGAESLTWVLPGWPRDAWAQSETGRFAYFSTPTPGRYTFALVAAATRGGRAVQVTAEHTVEVVGALPGPAPGPGPGPTPGPGPAPGPQPLPEPTFPPGRYGLAQVAYRAAAPLVAPASPNAKRAAEILRGIAANYSAVKSKAAAGVIGSPEAMATETRNRNREAAGADAALVAEALGAIKTKLDAAATAKELATLADYQAAWGEIAEGLGVAAARGPQ